METKMARFRRTMFSTNQQQHIKDFVVSYEALWEALRVPRAQRGPEAWNSIACWARILHNAQVACGIEILPAATCLQHVEMARAELAKIDSLVRERNDDARREALQDAADDRLADREERGDPPHNEPTIDGVY